MTAVLLAAFFLYVCGVLPLALLIKLTIFSGPEEVQRALDALNEVSTMQTPYAQTAKDLAAKIDSGEHNDASQQYELGGDFGRALERSLLDLGWGYTNDRYRTDNASFESRVKKAGRRVHITSMNFMGSFTRVEVLR